MGSEVAQLGQSQAPSRIAMGGGMIAHLLPSGPMLFPQTPSASGKSFPPKEPRGIAAFPDGRVLVLSETEPGRYVAVVTSKNGVSQTFPLLIPLSPLRDKLFRVQVDPQAQDEFVVVGDRGAIGYKLELLGDHLRRRYSYDTTPQEMATSTLSQDGSLWFFKAPGLGKWTRGASAPTVVPIPQLQEPIWHLSPGQNPQSLWATVGSHRIVRLVQTDKGMAMERTLDETPAVVHALSSHAGHVAALLVHESAGTQTKAVVVVFDAQGSQLLRQEVPGPFDTRQPWSVALSPSICAVASATQLRVFELATRKLILRQGDALPHID
ncbi:MAG TPA: hypothetical protein PKE31_21150 [Pseudomonadota bacterium]|nr:hypothetical protein [Pseudomonadota bacterium]HMU41528.1 hypothetical protein [Pseudomonadota bacterium]